MADHRILVFVHIPKTAGTTLREVVSRQYAPDATYTIDDEGIGPFQLLAPAQSKQIKLIMGHQKFGIHVELGVQADYFTMYREPVERVISHYQWIRSNPGNLLHGEVARMRLEDFAVSGLPHATNQQTEFTSGCDNPQNSASLELAKINLTEHFEAFGILERFDESLLLFKKKWGWANIHYFDRNIAAVRTKSAELPKSTVDLIMKHNGPDMELYEFACKRFDEIVEQQGPSFNQRLELFRLSNKMYRRRNGIPEA